jgi:hypothetical protein
MEFIIYILSLLIESWDVIKKIVKKIYVAILNFLEHIKNFFFNLKNRGKLKANQKAISILSSKVKEMLKDKSNYNEVNIGLFEKENDSVMNVVFDEVTGLDFENAELIEYTSLDNQTKAKFENKPMIILS